MSGVRDGDNAAHVIRHIDLSYDHEQSEQSATRLLETLLPEWRQIDGAIEFVRFTDGITNTLLKAVKKRPGQSQSQLDEGAVLLRAYGKGTDVLIDRDREMKAHSLLATRRLAPPLLARFNNGLLYKFIAGNVCAPEDLSDPRTYRAVARMLGKWHGSLPISAISETKDVVDSPISPEKSSAPQPVPNLWLTIQAWLNAVPLRTGKDHERKNVLQHELDGFSTLFVQTPGLNGKDFVFSHCDLLSGNVIRHAMGATNGCSDGTDETVSFIDYEYATPAPAAFDIANHFAEWAGFDCDYSAVPTKSQRKEFLTHYVQSFLAQDESSSSADIEAEAVERLYQQVDLYRGVPGFYWGIWALIQAEISQIDFDYASYAEKRLGEYWAWRAESDGSVTDTKARPLREKRWAEE